MKLLRIAFQKVPRQISPCLTSPKGTLRSDVLRSKPFINFSPFLEGNIFSQRDERSHWKANETQNTKKVGKPSTLWIEKVLAQNILIFIWYLCLIALPPPPLDFIYWFCLPIHHLQSLICHYPRLCTFFKPVPFLRGERDILVHLGYFVTNLRTFWCNPYRPK